GRAGAGRRRSRLRAALPAGSRPGRRAVRRPAGGRAGAGTGTRPTGEVRRMTEALDLQSDVRYALEWRSEPGWTELRCALRELLGGVDPTERVVALRHLKEKVLRLEFAPGTPWRSVVVKRLEPAVAQRNQLVATRGLPALEALRSHGIKAPPEYAGLPDRLLERLCTLLADAPRRAAVFEEAAGPDTLLHGDPWTINAFVEATPDGLRARLVDWDRAGVGPFSYDLSTFLFRFPPAERPGILERYRRALARAGWHLAPTPQLQVLFDTAERARYANRVIWPAHALLAERAAWGFPELAEVERWFEALDGSRP